MATNIGKKLIHGCIFKNSPVALKLEWSFSSITIHPDDNFFEKPTPPRFLAIMANCDFLDIQKVHSLDFKLVNLHILKIYKTIS